MASLEHTEQPAWDELLQGLPTASRTRFERLLRRALRREFEKGTGACPVEVPPGVRAEAVGAWRKQHVERGGSKASAQRMHYERLRHDPTYQQIERRLLERYLARRAPRQPADIPDVDALSLAEACAAYRDRKLTLGKSPFGGLVHDACAVACEKAAASPAVFEQLATQVCRMARTQRLSDVVSLSVADPAHPGRLRRQPFHLSDVSTLDEVALRVRDARLTSILLLKAHQGRSVAAVVADLLAERALCHPYLAAVNELVAALHDVDDPVRGPLERTIKPEAKAVMRLLQDASMDQRVARALLENPVHGKEFQRSVELKLRVRERVPDTPMEAYPLARTMERHFVLHVGPTNSGKTHDALGVLMAARSGAYLGPLRLLAYEQYERMNLEGCPCSLLTGEESSEVAGAHHVSSTVEMANLHERIAVAVIDEAQMIVDPDRGHHWTAAILGMPADEVHVCCAPHAERVVRQLVSLCDDRCEVVRHERLVPLRPDRGGFRMPGDVQRGDALIVFSRRAVHRVADEVAACGLRPSLIYGALPHDVRHEEARRFDEGETDVVVATDAIGMGMNLPIRRIVFVEQEKYDGHSLRALKAEEVQQIAGRAGRFGRYDVGYFQSTRRRKDIAALWRQAVEDITDIPMGIPDDIALVRDATLTDGILQWMGLAQREPFHRIDAARDLALIGEIEQRLSDTERTDADTKLLVLALATMPFDERERSLKGAWRHMVEAELAGRVAELPVPEEPVPGMSLARLEEAYRMCDLLYTYARTFRHPERRELLSERRTQISRAIIALLAER